MADKSCNDFIADSKYDYFIISNPDSVSKFIRLCKQVIKPKSLTQDINFHNPHGGVTLFCAQGKELYFCFDIAYMNLDDSIYMYTDEFNTYFKSILSNCKKVDRSNTIP